jgi:cytochrome P450
MTTGAEDSSVGRDRFIDIYGYEAHAEVLRSPNVSIGEGAGANDQEHFRGGTVGRLDGPEHIKRRRVMNRLLRAHGHRSFRDNALYPTLEHNLGEIAATADEDGVVRVELVGFLKRVSLQLAAALIGLVGVDKTEAAEELLELQQTITRGARDALSEVRLGFADADAVPAAVSATSRYVQKFYAPSLEYHQKILDRIEAGELSEDSLPNDLLSLIVTRADPAWDDPNVARKDTLVILRAGVNASTEAVLRALDELNAWLPDHPEDRARNDDTSFLLDVVNETMRLHPNLPGKLRRATQELRLESTGQVIPAGACPVLHTTENNRDESVFGLDAAEFNPYREIPAGAMPHGFSFGLGAHRCYGLPIVLGNGGIDGSLVHILQRLLGLNVRPDPNESPTFEDRAYFPNSVYKSYPVQLTLAPLDRAESS